MSMAPQRPSSSSALRFGSSMSHTHTMTLKTIGSRQSMFGYQVRWVRSGSDFHSPFARYFFHLTFFPLAFFHVQVPSQRPTSASFSFCRTTTGRETSDRLHMGAVVDQMWRGEEFQRHTQVAAGTPAPNTYRQHNSVGKQVSTALSHSRKPAGGTLELELLAPRRLLACV